MPGPPPRHRIPRRVGGPCCSEERKAGLGSKAQKPLAPTSTVAAGQAGEPTGSECVFLFKKRKGEGSHNFPGHQQMKPDPLAKGVLFTERLGEEEGEGRKGGVTGQALGCRKPQALLERE